MDAHNGHNHGGMDSGGSTTTPGMAGLMDDHNHGGATSSTDGPMNMIHMMQMFFYASAEAIILFSSWTTSSWEEMLGSCIGIAVISMLYEGLKAGRLWLNVYANSRSASVTIYNNGTYVERAAPVQRDTDSSHSNAKHSQRSSDTQPLTWALRSNPIGFHILQSVLQMIQVGVGYLLMLISMTFNAYLFISIVIGSGIGYLVFSYKRPIIVDYNEHCH